MSSDGSRATFDRIDIRSRFRANLNQPTYIRRSTQSFKRNLISDVNLPHQKKTQNPQLTSVSVRTTALTPQIVEPSLELVSRKPLDRNIVLPTSNLKTETKHKKSFIKKYSKLQLGLVILATCMVIGGGYITSLGWHANHIAQVQATKLTQEANKGGGTSTTPSTVKPSSSAVANYVVAPNLPRYLNIPKLGVHARIYSVGLTSSGALGVPDNVYNTDWYNESAQPGQPGAMLIDGHVSSWTSHGVFYGVKTLVAGDTIQVQRGDGTVFTYTVVKSQIYNTASVDMAAAMTPVVAGHPGLNLITCTGDVTPGTSEFNQRIVVFSEQVNS